VAGGDAAALELDELDEDRSDGLAVVAVNST